MFSGKAASEKQNKLLAKAGYSTAELQGLTLRQASTLIDYLSKNKWKRPNVAQQEAILAGEVLEHNKAVDRAIIMARIPTSDEFEDFTKDMGPQQAFALQEAMDDLKVAVTKGEEAIIQHGRALWLLKAKCKHGQWSQLLKLLGMDRTTAHRQIQLAQTHDRTDPKIRKMLEKRGVRFNRTMTARNAQIAQEAVEVAAKAAEEGAQMFHGETIDIGPAAVERKQQIDTMVEERVTSFLDNRLAPKPPKPQAANPARELHLLPPAAQSPESVAHDIAALVMDRLNTLVPAQSRRAVWDLVIQYVESPTDGHVIEEKLAYAAA